MADQGFPPQHFTTTTVSTETTVQTNLRYDPSYIKTRPGNLKVAQLVSNFLLRIFEKCLLNIHDSKNCSKFRNDGNDLLLMSTIFRELK